MQYSFIYVNLFMPARIHIIYRIIRTVRIQVKCVRLACFASICHGRGPALFSIGVRSLHGRCAVRFMIFYHSIAVFEIICEGCPGYL